MSPAEQLKRARPSKYRNKPKERDGEKYRSIKEMSRHAELLLLQKAGRVRGLRREVAFELAPAVRIMGRNRPPLRYFADFCYEEWDQFSSRPPGMDWRAIVEDCKGVRTEGYRIKRHLMKSVHGIDILET